MQISALDPITPAWNHMVRILFKPFAFKKWLALGFCAFLAQCGEQSGNGSNLWINQGNTSSFDNAKNWIESNYATFITWAIIVLLIFLAIALFITWISS